MKGNKRGFTLVELLVVIVVLGLLIALAMPSIIDALDSSSKNIFANQAIDFATKAKSKYEENKIYQGVAAPLCYTVDGVKEGTTYEGCVKITQDASGADKVDEIYIFNNEYLVNITSAGNDYAKLVSDKGKVVTKLTASTYTTTKASLNTQCPTTCVSLIAP